MQSKDCLIERLKLDNKNLDNELQNAEQNWRQLKRIKQMKEKEIHDLKRENKQLRIENLDVVSDEFKNLTNKVNREKKTEAKKMKKIEKKRKSSSRL